MHSLLIPSKSVLVKLKPEKIYAFYFFLRQIFIAILITFAAIYFKRVLLLLSLLFLLSRYYKYLSILSFSYYLTDQQLIIERGVFSRRVNYLELYRIKDIFIDQSFLMKLIGLMNITLLSFDNAESVLILKGIKVSAVPQAIRNHVQECRQGNKVLTVDN